MTLLFKKPCLLNVNTNRIYWHAGSGMDGDKTFDRYQEQKKKLGEDAIEIDKRVKNEIEILWKQQLEK